MTEEKISPKKIVLNLMPKATLDYYETLRGSGKPCWFVRSHIQGNPFTSICASPTMAWREAAEKLDSRLARRA